jgi:hypothetical protein
MNKPLKVVFEPGCFDDFKGSQEELDELIAQIHQAAESGKILENAVPFTDLEEDEFVELMKKHIRQ